MNQKRIVVLSGGLDSTALLYLIAGSWPTDAVIAVTFDYGQRHAKEVAAATAVSKALNVEQRIVVLGNLGLAGSALTDATVPVPHGHYAEETMRATVVPNRNAIFLSVATGIAIAEGAVAVAIGVHAGDHAVYPDCRPLFLAQLEAAFKTGMKGFLPLGFQLLAPFKNLPKEEIVKIGQNYHVPWEFTWSCYEGSDDHCGECGTCVERKEAFQLAGVEDPTRYAI